jgi:serine/threonine protein kinase
MPQAVASVETLCNLLNRSRLMKPTHVQAAYRQWRRLEARASAGEVDRFTNWLSGNHFVTPYQARQLAVGQSDYFFLNHYKLLDLIGQGRMAGIFKAAHCLGHIVAIKVLPPAKARDSKVLARFMREARMAVRLKHPHIVRTFHLGSAGGRHYIVMEHLEGETLEDVLQRRKKFPYGEAVRLVHQTLSGLQHIHEQGMIHRDLKPGNLMLVPPRPPGAPDNTLLSSIKILDIGGGRILFDETVAGDGSGEELTTAGTQLGTAEYMAPEQARDAHAADIRSDIYSLGCLLYHLLAGQPPFTGVGFELILRHLTEKPRPIQELEPDIPEGLRTVVHTMLAKDRNERYATPDDAAQALRAFLAAPVSQFEQPSSLTRSYLQWVEMQPLEETNNAPVKIDSWYYSRNGLTVGPIPTPQLPHLAASGRLGPNDFLWMEGDNPNMAIPAKAAINFAAIDEFRKNGMPAPAPVQPPPPPPTKEETGYDLDTGQVIDHARFTKWQKEQKARSSKVVASSSGGSVYDKAVAHLNQWLDLERNRWAITTGDMDYLRTHPDIQRFMSHQARHGAAMLHRLWNHFQFMVENRRKYYCALG